MSLDKTATNFQTNQAEHTTSKLENYLPPESLEECSPQLEEKFEKFFVMKQRGTSLIRNLQSSHSFKNPAILERVINYVGIHELGTNYPKEIFDIDSFLQEDYFDRIAEDQDKYWQQCELAKQQQTATQLVQSSNNTNMNNNRTERKRKNDTNIQQTNPQQKNSSRITLESLLDRAGGFLHLSANPDYYDYLHSLKLKDNNTFEITHGEGQRVEVEYGGKYQFVGSDTLVLKFQYEIEPFTESTNMISPLSGKQVHAKQMEEESLEIHYKIVEETVKHDDGYNKTTTNRTVHMDKNPFEFGKIWNRGKPEKVKYNLFNILQNDRYPTIFYTTV